MAGAWLLGAEARDTRAERPRAVLLAVTPADRTEQDAPGTDISLRELQRLADTDGLAARLRAMVTETATEPSQPPTRRAGPNPRE